MAAKEKARAVGPRAAVLLTSVVASFVEKHPDFRAPHIEFNGYSDDRIRFYCWGSSTTGHSWDVDYSERKRLIIEGEFNTIMEHFAEEFGELEWNANDPTSGDAHDKSYFILTATILGVPVEMLATRSDVGEAIGDVERDAEVEETEDGYVKVTRTRVSMWKPNLVLNNWAANGRELAVGRRTKELEA